MSAIDLGKNFSHTTLEKNPEKFRETIALIEKEFQYSVNEKYEIDFYPLVNSNNHSHCHLILDNESQNVIGHVGFLKKILRFQHFTVPAYFIGGICIKKDFQGMGLFKNFFKSLLNLYQKNVGLHILWSQHHELYQKFGFYPAGIQYSTPKSGEHFLTEKPFKAQPDLYNKIHLGYLAPKREENDWDAISKIKSTKLFYNDDNYFFMGKGFDLNNTVHEYFFSNSDIKLPFQLWSREPLPGSISEHVALIKMIDNNYLLNFFSTYKKLKNLDNRNLLYNCIQSINQPDVEIVPVINRLKLFISGLDSI